jgi:hypothetical protein
MTWGRGNHSIRKEQWRFTRYGSGGEELYDHATDPYEWQNLELDPAFSSICTNMRTLLPQDLPLNG